MTTNFDAIRVCDCMHAGIVSCSPDTPLDEVARMMGDYRVHAIAVAELGHGRPWGTWRIVSDMDVMAAVAGGQEPTACQVVAGEAVTVSADERLDRAAQVMSEHAVAHLVVVDPEAHYPVGIISTLDVASAYGDGQRRGVTEAVE
jgi:CBS domain-containing protein